jgi:hypothetical protein
VEFHGFEIPGIPRNWRNFANFSTRGDLQKSGLLREKWKNSSNFRKSEPEMLSKKRENAQLGASLRRE